jgi:hypothetical protein
MPTGELMTRATLMLTPALLGLLTTQAVAQRLAPESKSTATEANLTISAEAGGKSLQSSGAGSCRHAQDASINGQSASLWTVEYSGPDGGGVKQLNLTLWRPKDGGPDQLSLSLETKSGGHRIDTGGQGKHKGEGKVTILPSGPGGRLELTGKDGKGKPIQLTIDCPSFGEVEAEGD